MTTAILAILAGLVLLAIGAEGLVRGASRIALQLGVTPLVIGLTIVAAGTGSPEMVVSFQAAFAGSSDLALGNIVGSNIANVALILGLAAIVRPLQVRSALLLREMPIMIGVTLALIAMLADGQLGRIDGALLSIGAVVYTIGAYRASKRDRDAAVAEEFANELPKTTGNTASNVIFIVGGLGALVFGATLLVDGAVVIAKSIGMSEAVIGLTIVAIGTSLPELATSVLAAWRKDADVAFGNVLGSNILNILLVLGVVAVIQPIGAGGIRSLDLIAMAASAILLYPLMWRGRVLSRWEGGLLLLGYVLYLALALRA
ncbi:sodium:calcium antiporter [Ahniella affigens]|uniref:Sodium:calcium antiporter n=1 Tax=Ahniella affigens TaxID=2021234 RepID=A0A2P1PM70_9GAMM|nr:calcium/sodium antiporter [Ahniella affigens]AVP95940.1 sodium:calcium antiporter [Ahniella affigens]